MSRGWFGALMLSAVTVAGAVPLSNAAMATAAPVAVRHCTYTELTVKGRPGGAATGHEDVLLHFRNSSDRVCSIRGYPGAAGLNKHGKQVTQAKRTKRGFMGGVATGHSIPTVVLHPGQQATSIVEGTDVPQGNEQRCRELHGMLVTPPNIHKSVHVKDSPPDCSRIQIHPVIRGKTGNQNS